MKNTFEQFVIKVTYIKKIIVIFTIHTIKKSKSRLRIFIFHFDKKNILTIFTGRYV